jgi:hypothetical protein
MDLFPGGRGTWPINSGEKFTSCRKWLKVTARTISEIELSNYVARPDSQPASSKGLQPASNAAVRTAFERSSRQVCYKEVRKAKGCETDV